MASSQGVFFIIIISILIRAVILVLILFDYLKNLKSI